jgi:hypothetical protein
MTSETRINRLIFTKMKKNNEINISSERVLRNEDLLCLVGGVKTPGGVFICLNSEGQIVISGSAPSLDDCKDMCSAYGAEPTYYP